MLGGGDKGASGSLVLAVAADDLKKAVDTAYPRSHPEFSDKYAVHTCKIVDGIVVYDNVF
jgi:galactokinase